MTEEILFYAFRYALGRSTYAVIDVVDAICKEWPRISHKTRSLIRTETLIAIGTNRAGMDIDVYEWRKVLLLSIDAPVVVQ